MINLLNSKYNTKKNVKTPKTSKLKKQSNKNSNKDNNYLKLDKKTFIKNMKHYAKEQGKLQKYKPRSVENYCKTFYKLDILGKVNKNLYNSCKIHKYCRKNNCKNIDENIVKELTKKFGKNYNLFIQGKLRANCPLTVTSKNRKLCETKTLQQFYNKYNMDELYNKLNECNKKLCIEEKKIFYNNLFRNKQLKLNKKQRVLLAEQDKSDNPESDMYLIKNGDI